MIAKGKKAETAKAAAPAVKIITSQKAILKEAGELKAIGESYQQRLHVLACSVLAHVAKHGQINVLVHFLQTVPDMVRVNSLQKWFETFGNVTFSALENTDSKKATWRIDNSKKVRLGDAMVKPFWKFKANEGVPYEPLDLNAFINSNIKKLEKDIAECRKAGKDHAKASALLLALKTHNPLAPAN